MRESEIFSVFIVEDKPSARELLIEFVMLREELRLGGIAKNGEEALEKLSKKSYDLLFLDIGLPELSGIEVLDKLSSKPYVIFTTANKRYALKAFDAGAVDYLLKPFNLDRFNQAVDKALSIMKGEKISSGLPKSIGLSLSSKENHRYNIIISFDDIIYFSSHSKRTMVHTREKDYETHQLLKDLWERLSEDIFIRIHKQHIVNLSFISKVEYAQGGKYEVTLRDKDATSLPVGQTFASDLKKKLTI